MGITRLEYVILQLHVVDLVAFSLLRHHCCALAGMLSRKLYTDDADLCDVTSNLISVSPLFDRQISKF